MSVVKVGWSSFHPAVKIHATAASEPVLDYFVREAARDFCRRVKCWKETLNPLAIAVSQVTYPLVSPDDDANIYSPLNVQFSDGTTKVTVTPMPERALDASDDGWRINGTGEKHYFCPTPEELRITWTPTVIASPGLTVQVSLIPDPVADEFPRWIYRRWHEVIELGAVSKLLMMPKEDWSDPEKALVYNGMYDDAADEAKFDARDSQLSDVDSVVSMGSGVYT